MTEDRLTEIEKIINGQSNKPDVCHKDITDLITSLRAEMAKVAEWISVKDRLPDNEQTVIAYTKTSIKIRLMTFYKCDNGEIQWSDNMSSFYNGVATHWMSLPSSPKGV